MFQHLLQGCLSVTTKKIRVENQKGVVSSTFETFLNGAINPGCRPFRVLFIKPWQASRYNVTGPPLGILYLISVLRKRFGDAVTIDFWDMQVYRQSVDSVDAVTRRLEQSRPDVVAVSALNQEAACSYRLAQLVKAHDPSIITAIGGPFALRQANVIMKESCFDWVFEGAADRTFTVALERYFSGLPLGQDLPGFSYRSGDTVHMGSGQDLITDLDAIPLPAWDLIDFERYRWRDRPRLITNPYETRYAFLFTSRGCPYLCNYCHDIFTKRFVYRSEDNVIAEMRMLYDDYGVREFHIIDDIFNLHKPRAKALMRRIATEFDDILIAFPNGLRADILDKELIDLMVKAGTYNVGIAIETVTPRLQEKIEKFLDVEKANWAITEFARQGCIVNGFFMLGFPGETVEELRSTIGFAHKSALTHAFFFSVVPQPQTPIYDLAMQEAPDLTEMLARHERGQMYTGGYSWYSHVYGFDLEREISLAGLRFYLKPSRLLRALQVYPMALLVPAGFNVFRRFGQALWEGAKNSLRGWRARGTGDKDIKLP